MEGDHALPSQMKELEKDGKLIIDRDENELSSRFRPRDFVTTAIFTVDDDITLGCEVVNTAFRVWLQDPQKLVGFAPRQFHVNDSAVAKPHAWYTVGDDPYKNRYANFLFVTRGAFVHRDHLDEFFNPSYKTLRDEVDKHITGEDILFGFLHCHNHHTPPVPMVIPNDRKSQFENMHCKGSAPLMVRTAQHRQALVDKMYSIFGSPEACATHKFIDATTGLQYSHEPWAIFNP